MKAQRCLALSIVLNKQQIENGQGKRQLAAAAVALGLTRMVHTARLVMVAARERALAGPPIGSVLILAMRTEAPPARKEVSNVLQSQSLDSCSSSGGCSGWSSMVVVHSCMQHTWGLAGRHDG